MAVQHEYDVIVIGGGHAGAEAAWAVANLGANVALITMNPDKIGAMSCNPAIGGLAKGQIVREIDAMGGLMGLVADATGIQFRVLNASKGPAVQGPRCQSDKYRYAQQVQQFLKTRDSLNILAGTVEQIVVEQGTVRGVRFLSVGAGAPICLHARSVVLTTGTFMRGLMHTGENQAEGGRVGEGTAVGISGALQRLGFELGRLKSGTPPRLAAESINFDGLQLQPGDREPQPFSDLTSLDRFPILEQRPCHITHTNEVIHEVIRSNLDRAPMYNGQIETSGPRYCPSIEDKVVRFKDRMSHHVYLEPESLGTNEIYCNGISTSLPADVQEIVITHMQGCERAKVLRYGYAVEYDMVWPYQIDASCMTKRIAGLFLAGQINGTSGYEEAAGQGLMAGLNAARFASGTEPVRLQRDQAYIGVMMDDLVTKKPREPYRMFTSRAEYRLMLRADNADERLTPVAREWGLIDDERWDKYQDRRSVLAMLHQVFQTTRIGGEPMIRWVCRPQVGTEQVLQVLAKNHASVVPERLERRLVARLLADVKYAGYINRQKREVKRLSEQEQMPLPSHWNYKTLPGLRNEARSALETFRPATLGQATRLAGVTPADVMNLTVALRR